MVKNDQKMIKNEHFRKKKFQIFFFQIDSECFKTYFKPKMLISKKIPHWKFFLGLNYFLTKMAKYGKNDYLVEWKDLRTKAI